MCNHKILITASEVSASGHEDPLSSLENATLKIRTVFCSSGGGGGGGGKLHICGPLKFEFSNEV